MIKFLKVFLSSILTISFPVGGTKIFENITTKVTEKDSPFHPDITFSNSGNWTSKEKDDKKIKKKIFILMKLISIEEIMLILENNSKIITKKLQFMQ